MKQLLAFLLLLAGLALPASAVTPFTRVGDAAYTILPTDMRVATTTAFTAARTWTLPSAGATCVGQTCPTNELVISDTAGAITGTYTLTLTPASGETINGQTGSLILSAAGTRVVLYPTSGSNWQATTYGDYRVSSVATGSAVSLTTATGANITSLALSQGTWSCRGTIVRKLAASTSVTGLITSISSTSATAGTVDGGATVQFSTAANVMGADTAMTVGPVILAPTATTTYYLVANDTFTVSTNAGYGQLLCKRL